MIPYNDPASIGSTSPAFLDDLIATVLSIVVMAWSEALASGEINTSSGEPDIAGSLGKAMIIEKNRRTGIATQMRIEEEVGTRSSDEIVKTDGRIDIKIIYSFDEREYFGMECKKINSGDQDLAKKYVLDGIMRFVTGKYGRGHHWGAMLGFVLGGNEVSNWNLIHTQLKTFRKRTRMKGRSAVHRTWPSLPRLYRTHHQQYGQTHYLALIHLFLSFSTEVSGPPTSPKRHGSKSVVGN